MAKECLVAGPPLHGHGGTRSQHALHLKPSIHPEADARVGPAPTVAALAVAALALS